MIRTKLVTSDIEYQAYRRLCHQFVDSLCESYPLKLRLLEEYRQDILDNIGSASYKAPLGAEFIAEVSGEYCGTVALRKLSNGVGEIKRLFVNPSFRRRGVAKALMKLAVQQARAYGYNEVKLDTMKRQLEAQRFYESIGFMQVSCFQEVVPELANDLVYYQITL